MHQQKKTESLEINSDIYEQLIFNKGAKIIQCVKNGLYNKEFFDD